MSMSTLSASFTLPGTYSDCVRGTRISVSARQVPVVVRGQNMSHALYNGKRRSPTKHKGRTLALPRQLCHRVSAGVEPHVGVPQRCEGPRHVLHLLKYVLWGHGWAQDDVQASDGQSMHAEEGTSATQRSYGPTSDSCVLSWLSCSRESLLRSTSRSPTTDAMALGLD